MVYRIYVEKKPGFDGEAQSLRNELVSLLGIKELNGLRLLNRYDVEGIDEALFEQCVPTVFSEPPVDNTYAELPVSDGVSFAVFPALLVDQDLLADLLGFLRFFNKLFCPNNFLLRINYKTLYVFL